MGSCEGQVQKERALFKVGGVMLNLSFCLIGKEELQEDKRLNKRLCSCIINSRTVEYVLFALNFKSFRALKVIS